MNPSSLLNRDLLPHNACFGCGLENPAGLHIEVRHDPDSQGTLRATFTPTAGMEGFPGITHGGVVYTALDCLSTWVATLLGPNREAGWLLRSATSTYHRPAPTGQPLTLVGTIRQQAGAWDPLVVHTEARLPDGKVCVEADFKVVPLSHGKLAAVAGLAELPANWKFFLTEPKSP
jgi:acyl-coenzyme A thioesterase PaaI-like protein